MPTVTDFESIRIPNFYAAAPADFEAVEKVIAEVSAANDTHASACMLVRNYLDTLKNFRRIELDQTRQDTPCHAEVLELLRESGHQLLKYLNGNQEIELSASGYSRRDLQANVEYLDDRWDIWYGPKDEEKADAFFELIRSEG